MAAITVTPGLVTTVTLNRPEVRNAFNDVMVNELTAWARAFPTDGSVRVVVLRGEGPVFCAGGDLAWMATMAGFSRDENLEDARKVGLMLHALDELPAPLVGRVHGAAIGGGAGLAAVCDIVVAADDAVFGFTETTVGILPAMIGPYVVRKIGLSAARACCLDGAKFSAEHARRIGLVHDVVPAVSLDRVVNSRIEAFRAASPSAVAAAKRLIADVAGRPPADMLALTAEALARQRVSPDAQEGTGAFLDKRKPSWASADFPKIGRS